MTDGSWLVMSQGPQPGQHFILDKEPITIGRDPTNDIVINDAQVSRQHTRITRPGRLVIEDLGSTNGTFVNGMRLTGPHVLANGDVIGLGDAVALTFYEVGIAADTTDTVVGGTAAPAPSVPTYSPPEGPQPAPSSSYTPPPDLASLEPPAEKKKGVTWLLAGSGIVVALVIIACAVVFLLDYLDMLPNVFYAPLRWLGLFQ